MSKIIFSSPAGDLYVEGESYLDSYFYVNELYGSVDGVLVDGSLIDLPDTFEERMFLLEGLDGLVNLTPHSITLIRDDGEKWELPPTGVIPRAEEKIEKLGEVSIPEFGGIDITSCQYGAVVDLPEPKNGCLYIVSALTAKAAKGRNDLVIVSDTVRDDNGRIIGCRRLSKV